MGWLTPSIQKGIALTFVVSWYLAQGRLTLFWKALSGQVTVAGESYGTSIPSLLNPSGSNPETGPKGNVPGEPGGGLIA